EAGSAEGIVGFVCSEAGAEKAIIAECRRRLPTYMVPRKIVCVGSLPLNVNGKVDRNALRRDHLAAGGKGDADQAGAGATDFGAGKPP
ncbi:MAG: AMP-binding enzyme, partial [Caulobacteraceae bacterium]